MKKIVSLTMLGGVSLALAACGSSESASTEATADTVEVPADAALEPVTDEPTEDTAANVAAPEVEGSEPAPVTQEAAETAADNAAEVAETAEAAAAAVEASEAADAADTAAAAAAALEEDEE